MTEGKLRQECENAIEKHLASDEHCGITFVDTDNKQRIECPTKTGGKCECIAHRSEVQDEMAIEHHYYHSKQGKDRTENLHFVYVLAFIEQRYDKHGKHWT